MRTSVIRTCVSIAVATMLTTCAAQPTISPTPTPLAQQAVSRQIAEARVLPARRAALSLATGGVVAEVLVKEGDQVAAGAPILRLDMRRAEQTLAQAAADTTRAEAALALLQAGSAAPDIAVAQAQLARAEAQRQLASASVTSTDIAAAQARLQGAVAERARLRNQSGTTGIAAAETRLAQSQTALESERDRLSATKTAAQLTLSQTVDALTKAQSAYATASEYYRHVQDQGTDPLQPTTADATGKRTPNTLNDAQRRRYLDALVQAEAALRSAETNVAQAQLAFDTARQTESHGVQAAEEQVAQSQAALDTANAVLQPSLAAADANVASAQAALAKLTGTARAADVATAEAGIAEARAHLERLQLGARPEELAVAAADVQRARAARASAQAALDDLTLTAPFAGSIASITVRVGEYAAPATPLAQLGDLTNYRVETTDLTEITIVDVAPGARVSVTFDALPDLELAGHVTDVRSIGESRQGDIVYTVVVALDTQDPRLRWNMTASVAIQSPGR